MDKQLIAWFQASGPGARLEYPMDALSIAAADACELADGQWSPFHLLNAHRKNAQAPSRMFLAGEIHGALGDEDGPCSPRRLLADAHLRFERVDGAPYAALYDRDVRLAHLTPGGVWIADQGAMGGGHGDYLYLLAPAFDALRAAVLGPRQRLSPLAC